ncbi:polysaccharide biosynthesis tyrosine autokinase [Planctomycetota bacterium]
MADMKSRGISNLAAGAARRPAGPATSPSMTPKEVLGILRRHLWLIILTTLLGLCTGGASWYLLRRYLPSYTADSFVQVLPPARQDPTIITSTQVNKDIQYGFRLSMANLIKQQGMLQDLLKRNDIQATQWFNRMDRDATEATKYLQKHLGAHAHRDADFLSVTMTCRSARESADIVNAMTELFVQSQGGRERDTIAQKLSQLEERRVQVQSDIDEQNAGLDKIRAKWGIQDVGIEAGSYRHQHPIVAEYSRLKSEENQMLITIQQMQARIENVRNLATGPISVQVARDIERDPVMLALAQDLARAQSNLASIKSKFGPEHRVRKQLQEQIDKLILERQARMEQMAEQERTANLADAQQQLLEMQQRLAELTSLRQEAEARNKDMDMARIDFEKIHKVLEERVTILNSIREQIEKWRIKYDDPETPMVQVKSLAMAPLEMDASRHWMVWFPSGLMMGLLFGVAVAFLREMLNDLLRSPSDITRYLPVPLLGVIPDDTEDDLPRDVDLYQIVREEPYSIVGEAYRRLRTNLELSGFKSLLVAGADPEDGATSVATNLALSFAAKEKRVLLIDGNFRQPYIGVVFPAQRNGVAHNQFGLSNVLLGQCPADQAIHTSGIPGLDLLETGLLPPHPAELLGGQAMQSLLADLSQRYDHIIIDSPPLLVVSDAKILARWVDASLMVFHAAGTRRGAAQRAIDEIHRVRGHVAGCILFGVRAMKGGYFREQYKSYRRYLQDQLAS